MPNSKTVRPLCVACQVMFSDEDVESGNYSLVGMSYTNGPSFIHNKCNPGKAD